MNLWITRAALAASLLFAAPVAAETFALHEAPPAEGSGTVAAPDVPTLVPVEVAVITVAEDGADVGVPGMEVQLHIVIPPHTLEATVRQTTGDNGIARFQVPMQAGAEAYAEVDAGGRVFSDPVQLDDAAPERITLRTMRTTRDPSVLFAATMQTIVEPWEDYVVFSQVWTLGVDEMVRFESSTDEMGSIVRVPLPEGAEGVTVVHPAERARVMDGYVALGTDVAPAGMGDTPQRPHLIVRFSLPTEGSRTLAWEQELTMDVERASVVVPQVSAHAKHPVLDVTIDVPMCDDGAADGVMCFREITDTVEGTMLRDDMEVIVARGSARAGETMRVRTSGWPAPWPWGRALGLLLTVASVAFGTVLYRRELRTRRTARGTYDATRAALQVQQEQLLSAAADIEEQLARGELLQRDYDRIRGRIHEQLGVVFRRLRELESGPASATSGDEPA